MKKRKVLVVDDEIDFLEVLKKRLEANDFEVITAQDGKDALKRARKDSPDAILLDILMPEMNGLDVLKTLRKENETLPIFIITAFSNEERFKVANQFNASGFIVKTSDLRDEMENIKSAIDIAEKYKTKK